MTMACWHSAQVQRLCFALLIEETNLFSEDAPSALAEVKEQKRVMTIHGPQALTFSGL